MNEKELLNTLSSLKTIEPRKDWVSFVKTQILAQNHAEQYAEPRGSWAPLRPSLPAGRQGFGGQVGHIIDTFTFFFKKPAFAMAGFGLVIFLGLLFQFNQQRLAQDAVAQIALAQERLEQLQKIAAADGTNLSVALKEFQETSAKLSKEVPQFVFKNRAKALQAGIGIIQLQKSAADLERVYGISIGEKAQEDLQTTVKTLIENELADLAQRTLSAEQQALLQEAQAAFDAGDYESALEKIWEVSN